MKLSVVIPTLNERLLLPLAIDSVRESGPVHEIIVADGESSDGTAEWTRSQEDLKLVTAPPGRGRQLHAGASAATGDVLWFVHADCLVHPESVNAIDRAMCKPRYVAGAFRMQFSQGQPVSLEMIALLNNLRSRSLQSFTGAQGIFMRRVTYEVVGGYPDWPLFEDTGLIRKLRRLGRIALIPLPISVSARRYLACGTIRTTVQLAIMKTLFNAGAPPARLKASYSDIREEKKS